MQSTDFQKLALNDRILRALTEESYHTPTPIQQEAIPLVLKGRDLLATAQTGTGKTAAFSLPMLHRLSADDQDRGRHVRALILTPTRELALQVEESLRAYGRHLPLKTAVILGGVSQVPQVAALRKHPAIVVATPGRLLDLMGQGEIDLGRVAFLVLDEADRMLDMGFVHDVRRIVQATPESRQTLLFSATLSPDILRLAGDMLDDPVSVEIAPPSSVAINIDQKVLFVEREHKRDLLADILRDGAVERALVFARTKHRADRLSRQLESIGITAGTIHSNKSQGARQRALAAFDRGRIKVLVGTDIVARGIDVDGISHVINYEMPEDPENYVHRIGRTARAGAAGIAISFCDADEVNLLQGIEKLTRRALPAFEDHPFHSAAIAALRDKKDAPSIPGRFKVHQKNRQKSRPGRRAVR